MCRSVFLLAALATCLAAEALAQGEAIPDTTDWRRYVPLEVGNEWHYAVDYWLGSNYQAHRVVSDSLVVDGTRYFGLEWCVGRAGAFTCAADPDLIRYEAEYDLVVRRIVVQGEPREEWYDRWPCALAAPFGGVPVECDAPGYNAYEWYWVSGGHDGAFVVGPDTLRGVTWKLYGTAFSHIHHYMVADVGRVHFEGPDFVHRLVYARVGGREYGQKAFDFPSSTEGPSPARESAHINVFPNPTSGRATVVWRSPRSGTAEVSVLDVLGRLVHRWVASAAGEDRVELDLSDLPGGHYVVLVRAEGSVIGTARFAVAR
jgi:hypothetical protein